MNTQRMVASTGNSKIIRWIMACLIAATFSFSLTTQFFSAHAQASAYEGDVTPRPTGKNGAISKADYNQIGKFATGLETANSGSEFQRADCAPRSSLGDGKIGIADLVQAMRYEAGLDALTPVGGPSVAIQTEATSRLLSVKEMAREVRIGAPTYGSRTVTVPVELVAIGNENALGFTLAFDQAKLSNPLLVLGTDAAAALPIYNLAPVASGRIGIGIALPPGQKFNAGTRQILRVTFNIANNAFGTTTPIGFASSPVQLEISDEMGNLLDQRIFTGNTITLNNPIPTLTVLSPNSIIAGSLSLTLGVIGSNFVNGSIIRWNGVDLPTTFINSTLLSAPVPASSYALAGLASITVFNPTPGGGISNALPFDILNPFPTVIGLSSSTILAGSSGTLEIGGIGFINGSTIYLNGRKCPTRFISSTRLSFDYLAADIACAGKYQITVITPPPGGGTSSILTLTVAPVISSINPNIAYVGGSSFLMTVTGVGFCSGLNSIVWNGVVRPTNFVSATQLTTTVTAAELNTARTVNVSVITNDGVSSGSLPFTISACTPAAAKVTLASAINFGDPITPARSLIPLASRPSATFTVEDTGCQPLTFSFGVKRTGADVDSGKITNTDDSGTFIIQNISGDVPQEVRSGTAVTVNGFGKATFRIYFDPKIPAPAGGYTNLAASQVIPELINSLLTITSGGAPLMTSNLTGRVENNSRFINPLAPRLEPLVVFTKSGADEYSVEISGYDANANIYRFSYQFYDAAGNKIGQAPGFDIDLPKLGILKGQSFTLFKKFSASECGQNATVVRGFFYDREDSAFATSGAIGTGRGRVLNAVTVSAASFTPTLAANGIASAFSESFGNETAPAENLPLPTNLANVSVYVTDSNKVERVAPLFYVSPTQINYLIPEAAAAGEAKVVVAYKGEVVSSGTMAIAEMAPALFTANSDGQGAPSGYAVRVKADNSQSNESVYQYDALQKKFVPTPINLGAPDEQVFLTLFGTGIRNHGAMETVTAKIAGVDAEVVYAGPQGAYVGVDQVNIRVPRSLLVSGEIDLVLSIDGKKANTVRIQVR